MKLANYDMHIFMNPLLACTFDCVYCRQHTNDIGSVKEFEIERFIRGLERFNKTFLVTVSGGEPFLIPNIIEFAEELTKKHYIRIDTNLSLAERCRKFMSVIDPDRVVEIVFSTHVLERERRKIDIMELVSLVNEFQKKGFAIVGNYVAYPPLLERMERDIAFFASHGIKVLPNMLQGFYNGKRYPLDNGHLSYSEDALKAIVRLNPYAKIPLHSPRSEYCQAGSRAIYLNDKYEMSPCFMMRELKMGDFYGAAELYPKVIRCPLYYCTDQYNKTLCCTLAGFHLGLGHCQLRAEAELGVCSTEESEMLLCPGRKPKLRLLGNMKKIVRSIIRPCKIT